MQFSCKPHAYLRYISILLPACNPGIMQKRGRVLFLIISCAVAWFVLHTLPSDCLCQPSTPHSPSPFLPLSLSLSPFAFLSLMLTRPAAQLSVECVWHCSQELETQTQISNTHREYPLPSCLVMLVLRSFSLSLLPLFLSFWLSHSWFDCATLISNFERTFVPLLVPPQLCVCHQQLPQPPARPLPYLLLR